MARKRGKGSTEPERDKEKFRLSLDLSANEIGALFLAKGWLWADAGGVPTPQQIEGRIRDLVSLVADEAEAGYASLGRLVVFSDNEMPDSVEVALLLGHVSYFDEAGADVA